MSTWIRSVLNKVPSKMIKLGLKSWSRFVGSNKTNTETKLNDGAKIVRCTDIFMHHSFFRRPFHMQFQKYSKIWSKKFQDLVKKKFWIFLVLDWLTPNQWYQQTHLCYSYVDAIIKKKTYKRFGQRRIKLSHDQRVSAVTESIFFLNTRILIANDPNLQTLTSLMNKQLNTH